MVGLKVFSNIPFVLDQELLIKQLRIDPQSVAASEFITLLQAAGASAKPKAVYRKTVNHSVHADKVNINGVILASRALSFHVKDADVIFPYIATCGEEIDQIEIIESDVIRRFWLDTIKMEILETCLTYLNQHISRRYSIGKIANISPGSADVGVWPLEQQSGLYSVLGDVKQLIGVELTENYLMIPTMSASGLLFPTETDFNNCMLCHREDCFERSAPFSQMTWDEIYSS